MNTQKLESIQSKINTAVGMITVASMSIDEVKQAHSLLIEASIEIDEIFNEE